MVSTLRWERCFRVIASKYPTVSVYDRITDAKHFEALLEVEALTNPRVREEAGDFRKIRPEDRIAGPGSTPVMASFAYSGPSRFCDGTYGVFYAGHEYETAVAESLYHTELFLRATREPGIDVDKRVYEAALKGRFDDVRSKAMRSKLYDPVDYAYSQKYARRVYETNAVDGIVYRSVRRQAGECCAAFRPRSIANMKIYRYIQFRWDGEKIVGTAALTEIRGV